MGKRGSDAASSSGVSQLSTFRNVSARTVDLVLDGVRSNPGCLDSGAQSYRNSIEGGLFCLVQEPLLSLCVFGA